MAGNDYFGDLTVGTVLDCQAVPGFEGCVARGARTTLQELSVDISLTNQLHSHWQRAFRAAGYISGRSNYMFAASPALLKSSGGVTVDGMHVTRGDGDGRIHL